MKKFKFNEHQIFSIRKISLGVVSVLLGSVFAITSQISQVKANVINTTLSSTDTLNKDEAYNSYVFSGSDNLKDNKNHSTLKLFDKVGDGKNRNNSELTFGEDSHGKYMEWKSDQTRGGGFKLEIDKELNDEYTIGVKFSFNNTSGRWRKIIDYKNSNSDTGFYFYNEGHLQFYPSGIISKKAISNNEVVNFIIVRSKTEFAVYLVKDDGSISKEFSLTDSTTLLNSIPYKEGGKTLLGFFFDDTITSSEATNGGKIYSLTVYDKEIDPNKVLEKLNKPKDNEIYQPILRNPLPDVEKGTNPDAKDFIKNLPNSNETNKLPENTRISWKTDGAPDTSTVGKKSAEILINYPDGTTDELSTEVNVVSRDFTPVVPRKTPVTDLSNLTVEEIKLVKTAVEGANPDKTVEVDETGKAIVSDKITHISHEIPAKDLISIISPINEVPEYTEGVGTSGVDENGNLIVPPINEVPEYTEGIGTSGVDENGNLIVPPINEVPEYTEGVGTSGVDENGNLIDPPINEVPEYTEGVGTSGVDENGELLVPPINEVPEYTEGVGTSGVDGNGELLAPPINEVPEYTEGIGANGVDENGELLAPPKEPVVKVIIIQWIDENNHELKPAVLRQIDELTDVDELLEHGEIPGYRFIETQKNKEKDVVKHIFRKVDSGETLESNSVENQNSQLVPTDHKHERVSSSDKTDDKYKNIIKENNNQNTLPNTGTEKSMRNFSVAILSIFTALGCMISVKKENKDIKDN